MSNVALTTALYSLLVADAELIGQLDTFNGRPAIFTYQPVPQAVDGPYIVSAGNVSNNSFDTKTSTGRRITRDIRCYARDGGDAIPVETVADRVLTLLHRQDLTISGFKTIYIDASGPVTFDEDGWYGRIVTAQFLLTTS